MSKVVQEKFQTHSKPNKNDNPDYMSSGEGWVTDAEARTKKGNPGREGAAGGDGDSRFVNNAVFLQSLPPGMDIEDQEVCDIRKMEFGGSLGSGTQATDDVTAQSLRAGYSRKKMSGTDDMYSNEHVDVFYTDAEVDGLTGFVERGNLLDRE
jgi:hypothetical protein